MPICNDPAITYLKSYGYSVLRLPRRDFAPLQILLRRGANLVPLGQLATVMVAKVTLPSVRANVPAATINGQKSSSLSLGVGLNILGGVIGAMGGGNLGLDATYKNAKSVAFEFSEVFADDVEIALLEQYLATADVNPASKHVAELLDADDVYVVTAVIKSAKFTIAAKDEASKAVSLDVPTIQGIVGGKVAVSASAAQTGQVSYEGTNPLVFGFQAIQLFYDGGQYTAFEPLDAGVSAAKGLPRSTLPKGVHGLATTGPFARIG